MKAFLLALDGRIRANGLRAAWLLAVLGIVAVGAVDYLSGYEISMSLFYLAPVAIAAWYGGRRSGLVVALTCCTVWYLADQAAGHQYSSPVIPVWNAIVRLGFFVVTALLLAAIRSLLGRLWSLAQTDSLTGLFGRRAFDDRLEHDLAMAQRHKTAITLAYIDVDDFKKVNDTYGHARGDRVLQLTGRVLAASIRRVDTAARLGGDEFALILPDTDEAGARHLAEGLSRKLGKVLADEGLKVTFSMGAVTFTGPPVTPAEALAAADSLMYEIKRQGKAAVGFRSSVGPAPRAVAAEPPRARAGDAAG